MFRKLVALAVVATMSGCLLTSANAKPTTGTPDLKSAGPLAFTPNGVLLVGDAKAATIFAIQTDDVAGNPDDVEVNIPNINEKIAGMLGTHADEVQLNDLVVNPSSGNVYLSVSRGRGPDAAPVIMKVSGNGDLSELSLENVEYDSVALPNAPEDAMRGEGRRRGNPRMESITDLAFLDGTVFVAGLSNEEFASKLRKISYPFESADTGTSVEIYHGAHGQYETRSPIRTFATYKIDSDPHLLAAYTCTPLVKFPVTALDSSEAKVMGTTVAELGNRNRPLDMIIYQQDGTDYVLMANSSRGLMKIATEGIADIEGISERISGTAGLEYNTIDDVEGVVQLDRLNTNNALVMIDAGNGTQSLETIPLP